MQLFSGNGNDTEPLKVKICGLAQESDLQACADLGVNAVGFLLNGTTTEDEQDKLSLATAKRLIEKTPLNVTSVVLIKDDSEKELLEKIGFLNPGAVQLQNPNIGVPQLKLLSEHFPHVERIKTIRITDTTTAAAIIQLIDSLRDYVDAVLLDSVKGGGGKTHNWDISADIAAYGRSVNLPVVLAGGLNLDNIQTAVSKVSPFMIDLMSGMSKERGVKDLNKIEMLMKIFK